ncbi:MAG: hypothetical protein IJS90_06505 [Clostridia bacterium]|nr:hypothetical protein [Clostridia bacterium]
MTAAFVALTTAFVVSFADSAAFRLACADRLVAFLAASTDLSAFLAVLSANLIFSGAELDAFIAPFCANRSDVLMSFFMTLKVCLPLDLAVCFMASGFCLIFTAIPLPPPYISLEISSAALRILFSAYSSGVNWLLSSSTFI